MGTVYLAEQEEPVQRRVALKLLRQGKESDWTIARFEAERQALALMNHSCIATVFHAGATDDGLPYFAMEVVNGEPITSYCDDHRLSIRQRLELFLQVCDAVEHAHQKMVIHRDLKPSNILVCTTDDQPQPKIIDFGVAKGTHRPLVDESRLKPEESLPVGTPLYMSPEQILGEHTIVDARADVYSLGVLLYELLAGPLPFPRSKASIPQLLVRLIEFTPPSPSLHATAEPERARQLAHTRSTSVRALGRFLRGDLDRITMKAMAKDRGSRYGSVAELRADISRHLRNEPVQAVPWSCRYRAHKYLRRYRISATATLIVFGMLVVGIITTSRSMRQTERALERALAAEKTASGTLEYTSRVLGGLSDDATTPREQLAMVLRQASDGVGAQLQSQPLTEAAVRKTIGVALLDIGDLADARTELERSAALYTTHLGEEHPTTVLAQAQLARLALALGHAKEAATQLRTHLDRLCPGHQCRDQASIEVMRELALALDQQGSWQEAGELLREAVAQSTQQLGAKQLCTLVTTTRLSHHLARTAMPEQALQVQRDNVELLTSTCGPFNIATLEGRLVLAEILQHTGRWQEAAALARSTLDTAAHKLGATHPTTLAAATRLAVSLGQLGEPTEAQALLSQVLDHHLHRLGPTHADTLEVRALLGLNLLRQGKADHAEPHLADAATAARATLGADHWKSSRYAAYYGTCLLRLGQYDRAETWLLRSLAAAAVGPTDTTADVSRRLVALYRAAGRQEQAVQYSRQASSLPR